MNRKNEGLISLYLKRLGGRTTESTRITYGQTLSQFNELIGKGFDEVQATDVWENYLHALEKTTKRRTMQTRLARVNKFFRHLVISGELETNPVEGVFEEYRQGRLPQIEEQRCPSKEEVRKLLKAALNPRDRALICLLAKTGLRNSEAHEIKLEDVDLKEGEIVIRRGKGGASRKVFMDNEMKRIMERWLNVRKVKIAAKQRRVPEFKDTGALFITQYGLGMTSETLRHIVHRVAIRAELMVKDDIGTARALKPHSLRHTFTSLMILAGVNPLILAKLRGDRTQRQFPMLSYYFHPTAGDLKAAYLNAAPTFGI